MLTRKPLTMSYYNDTGKDIPPNGIILLIDRPERSRTVDYSGRPRVSAVVPRGHGVYAVNGLQKIKPGGIGEYNVHWPNWVALDDGDGDESSSQPMPGANWGVGENFKLRESEEKSVLMQDEQTGQSYIPMGGGGNQNMEYDPGEEQGEEQGGEQGAEEPFDGTFDMALTGFYCYGHTEDLCLEPATKVVTTVAMGGGGVGGEEDECEGLSVRRTFVDRVQPMLFAVTIDAKIVAYGEGPATIHNDHHTNSERRLLVRHDWMTGGGAIKKGTEAVVYWNAHTDGWTILAANCPGG